MIWLQIAFDIFMLGVVWAFWTIYQKLAESQYEFSQWVAKKFNEQ